MISVQGLICKAGERTLLEIDHLVVRPGERVAVVGHNGAGKSTLLRALSGFVRPVHGCAHVLGQRLEAGSGAQNLRALRRDIGQVLQGLHMVQRLSVIENVLIGGLARLSGWRGWARCYARADITEAEAALRAVGLLAKADERTDKLSGGERQKVAIARMLMQRARLILADEPTASLDPLAAAEICRQLALAAKGATLITVVHNPSLIPLLADRVLGLRQGKLVFDMPVSTLDDASLAGLYRPEGQSVLPMCGATQAA